MKYFEKLKDPRWQKLRLLRLERSEWQCELCCDSESTLHVHHKHYFKGREPWEYDIEQLAVLCAECHESQHEAPDLLMEVVSRLPLDGPHSRELVAFLIAGFIGREHEEISGWNGAAYLAGESAQKFIDDFFDPLRRLIAEADEAQENKTAQGVR